MPKRKPKDPERSPDLPHDWIQRHLTRLEKFVCYDPIELTPWQYRRARLTGPGEYEYLDSDWGTINLGDYWGGHDITAFFRKVLKIPASHAGPDAALDLFLDGGETPGKEPSTLVDLSGSEPRVLRDGAAPWSEFRRG